MQDSQNKETGLSSANINLLVGLLFIVLLLIGPMDPFGIIGRIAYLILLPFSLWFILSYFGKKWTYDAGTNERFTRFIAGTIA